MKISSNILKGIQFLIVALFISQAAFAQDSTKQASQATAKDWVNERNFVFTPQTAMPMRGHSVHLTSYFDLRISKDTLISNLPYYGRAYSASINPSENGLNFTSTKFDYNVTPRKKGGWEISIKPKDANDIREMTFTVFDNGKASLFVNSNNRESISFDGSIAQNKKR
jgi:hypothetical protein